ncbi:MAG: hypothetical protein LM573_07645 [Thermofilum sp.]|nr:hypothetical protein [Thermofilum sp.]
MSKSIAITDHSREGSRELCQHYRWEITTARLIGEKMTDFASERLAITQPRRTPDTPLAPYWSYFT